MPELTFIKIIGWLAGFFFAICGVPQAVKSFKDGHSEGLSNLFLFCWTAGEVLMIIYVIALHGFDGPLLFNYVGNLVVLAFIIWYKFFPRIDLARDQIENRLE